MGRTDEASSRGRGRPRDPSYDDAIREATTELLAEDGYQGLTMIEVARRAGVAKTTIYRRWSTKAEMVLDAVSHSLEMDQRPLEDITDPVDGLRRLVVRFYRRLAGHSGAPMPVEPAVLLRQPEVVEAFRPWFLEPVRARGTQLVRSARNQGRLNGDMDAQELVDLLLAPALYRAIALGEVAEPELAERILDVVIE